MKENKHKAPNPGGCGGAGRDRGGSGRGWIRRSLSLGLEREAARHRFHRRMVPGKAADSRVQLPAAKPWGCARSGGFGCSFQPHPYSTISPWNLKIIESQLHECFGWEGTLKTTSFQRPCPGTRSPRPGCHSPIQAGLKHFQELPIPALPHSTDVL